MCGGAPRVIFMNRIPVFVSFDYAHDLATKNRLVTEWNNDKCPIWIKDCSLELPVTDHRWQTEAALRIDTAKAVLVICGKNTHSADGVKAEVQMALQRKKPVFYLRAVKEGSSLPTGVEGDTKMLSLDWKTVYEHLTPVANR
jgi:MTH538 TIR-like domain (DUF1863)